MMRASSNQVISEEPCHDDSPTDNGSSSGVIQAPMEYMSAPVYEEEEDDEEGYIMDNNIDRNNMVGLERNEWSEDTWCVVKVASVLGLAVMIAVLGVFVGPAPLRDNSKSGSATGRGRGYQPPFLDLKDSLGTCFDPIYELQPQASIQYLANGAVASDHPLCSEMGMKILRDSNGTAVDAAVTVALCLGVANPASSGMGGGAFILVHADFVDNDNNSPLFIDARQDDSSSTSATSGKRTEVIDARETAPAGATQDMFLDPNVHETASTFGGLASGIPGELKGLELAHQRYGSLEWQEVVRPVMQLARDGIPVNANLAHEIQRVSFWLRDNDNPEFLKPLRKVLTRDDSWNHPLQEGDLMYNPALAQTLEEVMREGSSALFSGERAETLAAEIQAAGGIITAQELADYRPTLRNPLVAHNVNGFSIVGVPPPSSGGAAVIGVVRFLSFISTPLASYADTLSKHWFVEACRHIFAIRMSLSDPAFNTETVKDAVNDLVGSDYIASLADATNPDGPMPSLADYGGTKWTQITDSDGTADAKDGQEGDRRKKRRHTARRFGYLEDHGTSHFSVVDKYGNAVAMTTTVNTYFGSSVMSESTGIVFNSQMDDFSTPGEANAFGLAPAESNFIAPGKKPLSSMSPTLVFRTDNSQDQHSALGLLVLAIGASGGPKIITAVAQVLLNRLVLGLSLFESMVYPRVHNQLLYRGSAVTCLESSEISSGTSDDSEDAGSYQIIVSQKTRQALKRRKHDLLNIDYAGAVQAIAVDLETNTLDAVCDVRKGGSPAGY